MPIYNPIVDRNGYQTNMVDNAAVRGSSFIRTVFTALMVVGIIYFIYNIIIAGLAFINSSGDEKKMATAKNHIMSAFIGLIVMFAVFAFLSLLQSILGIDLIKLTLPIFTQ